MIPKEHVTIFFVKMKISLQQDFLLVHDLCQFCFFN